jgi:isopenicillin N synthase-like dioxygenase
MAQSNARMIEPTEDPRAIYLMNHPDSVEDIPVIDMGPTLAGEPGAEARMAAQLREVTETVGFFYLKNHPVSQSLIERMFIESKRFFALPLEEKRKIPRVANTGYVEMKEPVAHKGNEHLIKNAQPALNESFIIARERTPDDPDFLAGKLFASLNTWPDNLPVPHCNLRLAHYPPQATVGQGQYGINPHTDNCLMTFLAQANVPGLAVQMPSGHWRTVELDAALDQRALQIDQACGHQCGGRRPLLVPRVLWTELRRDDRMPANLPGGRPGGELRAHQL